MPARKGQVNPGAGRPPGSANKSTIKAREAIAQFVDGNAQRLNGWLDAIAVDSPKDAFNCFMSVVEYNLPKLARKELVGDPDKPLEITGTVRHFLETMSPEAKRKLLDAIENSRKQIE